MMYCEKDVIDLAQASGFGTFKSAVRKTATIGFRDSEAVPRPSRIGSPNLGRNLYFIERVTLQYEDMFSGTDIAGILATSPDGSYDWHWYFKKSGSLDFYWPMTITPNAFVGALEVTSRAGAQSNFDSQILYWELAN